MRVQFNELVIKYYKFRKKFHEVLDRIWFSTFFPIVIAFLLFLLIKKCGVEISLESSAMFAYAIGLITCINIIIGFWNSKTTLKNDSESYYLGRNIGTYRIHNNKWIKLIDNIPLKPFFLFISIIPAGIWLAEVFGASHFINDYSNSKFLGLIDNLGVALIGYINEHMVDIKRLWMSIFLIVAFVCITALIEIIILYRISFIKNQIKSTDTLTKILIENNIRDIAQKSTENLFSIVATYYHIAEAMEYINRINITISGYFDDAVHFCNNNAEHYRFLENTFTGEASAMDDFLEKILKTKKHGLIFKNHIEMIHFYYWNKWKYISRNNAVPLLIIIKLANRDLGFLTSLESKFSTNEYYKSVFWGEYFGIDGFVSLNGKAKCNTNISLIVDVLSQKVSELDLKKGLDPDFLIVESVNENISSLFALLENIKSIDKNNNSTISVISGKNAFEYLFDKLCEKLPKIGSDSQVYKRIRQEIRCKEGDPAYSKALDLFEDKI